MQQLPIRSAFADDPDMAELVRFFVADLPSKIAGLQAAAADPSSEDSFRRLAHQMKGAAGGYGFPQLTEVAGRIEHALSEGARPAALSALDELAALCARAEAS